MKYYKPFCFFLYLLFILSCAKQTSPTGGPKDSIPPILIKTFPAQKQLNFHGKEIKLQFSEAVNITNPKEQLLITPTISKEYKATAKKKEVTIEFEEAFKDSATYTINFRDAVQDITEKNPAKNLQLAFSTGPYIDSLSIEGTVIDLLKGKEIKEATIALYQNADTFNIFKHKPTYVTKSNDKGYFKIENLKPGNYSIYSFEDKNKNLIVDSKAESYGFIAKPYALTNNIKDITIPLIRLDARPLKLTSARPYNNYFNIRLAKNIVEYAITSDSLNLITCFGDEKSNVKVFNTLGELDSLKTKFCATDSIGNTIDSTFYIKFSKKQTQPEKFGTTLIENKVIANKGKLIVKLSFTKPISTINYDSIFFQPDSTTTIHFIDDDLKWDFQNNALSIEKEIDKTFYAKKPEEEKKDQSHEKPKSPTSKPKPTISNQLTIGKGAFISIDKDSCSKKTETTKIIKEEETGILLTKIETTETNYITSTLSKDLKIIEATYNITASKFENLLPASYFLILTIDSNQNGKWDAGNFFKKIEPEKIIYYKNEKQESTINLKANWELGPLLIKSE